jgi:hypothetical protein
MILGLVILGLVILGFLRRARTLPDPGPGSHPILERGWRRKIIPAIRGPGVSAARLKRAGLKPQRETAFVREDLRSRRRFA